jgi:hypothetical protein
MHKQAHQLFNKRMKFKKTKIKRVKFTDGSVVDLQSL